MKNLHYCLWGINMIMCSALCWFTLKMWRLVINLSQIFIFENLLWQLKFVFTAFIFLIKWKHLKNYEKYFKSSEKWKMLYQKSSFRPRDIQFSVLTLFYLLDHCWIHSRISLMTNRKVYDIIMCLNWILKTQILWYLEN